MFEILYENQPPTRLIKYKRIDFAPCIFTTINYGK